MPRNEPSSSSPAFVTVVESEACHFCADAQRALTELARDYPLTVRTIDVRSTEGQGLMQRHGAAMSPLVLLEGQFFSHGRLPRRKLRHLLADRYGAAQSASAG